MSAWLQIILTAALTLVGGIILLLIGEFTKTLIILPLQKFREQVQLILDRIDFYANKLTNHYPEEPSPVQQNEILTMNNDLRSAATQLRSKYQTISCRRILVKIRYIPSIEQIEKAYSALLYLHNSTLYAGQVDKHSNSAINHDKIEEIKNNLTT